MPAGTQKCSYDQILSLVSTIEKVDFSKHKESAIKQRVLRRIAIKGLEAIENIYFIYKDGDEEAWIFMQDKLIFSSEFCRYSDQYDALK